MKDDYMDLGGLYESTTKGYIVPPAEEHTISNTNGNAVFEQYLGTSARSNNGASIQEQAQAQTPPSYLTEKQQRNQLLYEASSKVNQLIPFFESIQDKKYISEIKEALEELMN